MNKILFLTNGRGEDLVADYIIKHLNKNLEILKISLVDSNLPSGGFSLRNFRFLLRDLFAGLFTTTFKNVKQLLNLRGKVNLTIAIGDIVPILGALMVGAPFIFVGVNKSDYYRWFGYSYTPWEKWLMKKYAKQIFVRDQLTADYLNRQRIPAKYVGNPLMDCFEKIKKKESKIENNEITIGFLPGTRNDAKLNLEDFDKVVEELVALKDPDTRFRFLIATTLPEIPEYMERKTFAEVLAESNLIVGLSGTGNEQSAGYGVPVVSFYGRGAQYNKKFAEAQKQLLGEALCLIKSRDPKTIAFALWQLLKNPDRMKTMGEIGKKRMGDSGAVEKIANYILNS